jgi:hypothetical protein
MSIDIRFLCGHGGRVGVNQVASPVCPTCGETRIARVSAPPPKFRGACSGPYAATAHLDPAIVNVAPKGPLQLKEQK